MNRILAFCIVWLLVIGVAHGQQKSATVDLTKATIVYLNRDAPLVRQMAQVLADDIERVSGKRPEVSGNTQREGGIYVKPQICKRYPTP